MERFARTISSLPSPATTTRPSAFCIRASTRRGRCGSALARLGRSIRATPRPPPSRPSPSPKGLTPNIPAADYAADPRAHRIAAAAKKLDDLRRAWLNPPDLVDIVPEVTPTAAPGEAPRRYPDRIVPKTAEAAVEAQRAHADQSLQPAPALACRRARSARPRRRRRLRLARGYFDRRRPRPPARAQPRTRKGAVTKSCETNPHSCASCQIFQFSSTLLPFSFLLHRSQFPQRLRDLLLDGAASPATMAADDACFEWPQGSGAAS